VCVCVCFVCVCVFCVCVALGIQHAVRMRRMVWPPWLFNIFPHYPINGTILGLTLLKIIFCFHILYNFETFLILRRIERDILKKWYIRLHVKNTLYLPEFDET